MHWHLLERLKMRLDWEVSRLEVEIAWEPSDHHRR